MQVARHIQAAGRRSVVGARGEVEILPAFVIRGKPRVAQSIRHLRALAVTQRKDFDRMQAIGKILHVGQPLRIWRPREIAIDFVSIIRVDFSHFPGCHFYIPQMQLIVIECDVFTVGRPARIEIEGGLALQRNLVRFTLAILRLDMQRVLARFIRKICDRFPIRRPDRRAIHYTGRVCQIAEVAFFRRRSQNLAMHFEHGSHATRRNPGVANFACHVLKMRTHLGEISFDLNWHRILFPARDIVDVNLPELLIDNPAGSRAGGIDVLARVFDQLGDRLALRIVAEQGHFSRVTVRQEKDFVPDPHRINVVRIRAREFLGAQIGQIHHPQIASRTPAVPLPRHKVIESGCELAAIHRRVHHALAIRRISAKRGHGQRQYLGQTTVRRNRVELVVARITEAIGAEQDALAVGSPTHHAVRIRMIGGALGNAAARGHAEHVDISVIFARECDGIAVRRKRGLGLHPRAGRQPCGHAALPRHAPQIAGVGKYDLSLVHGRFLQQMQRGASPERSRNHSSQKSEQSGIPHKEGLPVD